MPRLLDAYRHGIFPWFSEGDPILWWSPDPRMVLEPGQMRVTRSLAKTLRNRSFEVRADTAFREVMLACAQARRAAPGTWITDAMVEAYCALHAAGHAHSIETWVDGRLAGGLYGVAIGRAFFGESMFSHVSDGSKIALAFLDRHLQASGFGLVDCQMSTPHLASLGAHEVSRARFVERLAQLVHCVDPPPGPWSLAAARG